MFVGNLGGPWSSGAWGPGPNGPVVNPPLIIPVVPCICYYKIVISMAQYGGMSLTRLREELRKQHAKCEREKKNLAVGDNGVYSTILNRLTVRSRQQHCSVYVCTYNVLSIWNALNYI